MLLLSRLVLRGGLFIVRKLIWRWLLVSFARAGWRLLVEAVRGSIGRLWRRR